MDKGKIIMEIDEDMDDNKLDPVVIDLLEIINRFTGIKIYSSYAGHDKDGGIGYAAMNPSKLLHLIPIIKSLSNILDNNVRHGISLYLKYHPNKGIVAILDWHFRNLHDRNRMINNIKNLLLNHLKNAPLKEAKE